jgi:hypothetical protein
MRFFRFTFTIIMALLIVYTIISRVPNRAPIASVDAFMPAPKSWHEIGRRVLVDQSWEMANQTGWWMEGMDGDPNGVHLFLDGTFASSDPAVRMIVMDKDNWQKWQAGFPPLDTTSAVPGQNFHLPASTTGYYFGFWPAERALDHHIPASTGQLALRLLQMYQETHPAPVRMTARVLLIVESFSTPIQAAAETRAFAAIKK